MNNIVEIITLVMLCIAFIGLVIMEINEIIKSNKFYKRMNKELTRNYEEYLKIKELEKDGKNE